MRKSGSAKLRWRAPFEVELVEAGEGALSEVGDAVAEAIVLGQLGPLGDQCLSFVVESTGAGVEFAGASSHVGDVDHSGLVEVGESAPLSLCGFSAVVQAG